MQSTAYNVNVFINCPFDDGYRPLLFAIVYTVYRCGFIPHTALGEDDGTDFRLSKIMRQMSCCRYGIHDVSRTECNERGLPRFNMPFETGIFFAAKYFGNRIQQNKQALIFEREKYLYQQYISDLNGIDTKAHQNDPGTVIEKVRNWLRTASRRENMPGSNMIRKEFAAFLPGLPFIMSRLGLDEEHLPFSDLCLIIETMIKEKVVADDIPVWDGSNK